MPKHQDTRIIKSTIISGEEAKHRNLNQKGSCSTNLIKMDLLNAIKDKNIRQSRRPLSLLTDFISMTPAQFDCIVY